MPANLRDYVQHKGDCGGDFCSFPEPNDEGGTTPCCGGPDGPIHIPGSRFYNHAYQRGVCTCGLSALLSSSSPETPGTCKEVLHVETPGDARAEVIEKLTQALHPKVAPEVRRELIRESIALLRKDGR